MLVYEMLYETGPYFLKSVLDGDIIEILASYSKYLKHKHLHGIPGVFHANSLAKSLTTASQVVSDIGVYKGSRQEEAANDIWRAGEEITLARSNTPKLLMARIRLCEYRKVPEKQLNDIKMAIEKSKKQQSCLMKNRA